jgi:hypothetical protein
MASQWWIPNSSDCVIKLCFAVVEDAEEMISCWFSMLHSSSKLSIHAAASS